MKSDKLIFQVQFWALIGPFISLLSLFVFFVKGSTNPAYLPFILLLGVPLCWKWKLKGFAASVSLLCAIFIYYYPSIPLEDKFWHLGMGISIAMSLLITALSFEEVEALIEGLKVESKSRLENLWKVDERLQLAEGDLKKKKERIRELNIKNRSYQKLIDRTTEELVELRTNYDKAVDEIYQTKQERDQLEQKLSIAIGESPTDTNFLQLQAQFEENKTLLDEARRELFRANERTMTLERELEEMKIYELSEVEQKLEKHLRQMEIEKEEREAEHQRELDSLNAILEGFQKNVVE